MVFLLSELFVLVLTEEIRWMFWRFRKVHFHFLNTFELPFAVTAHA